MPAKEISRMRKIYDVLRLSWECQQSQRSAMDATNPAETMIIVSADHSHVFAIPGYPRRGNPILGKVVAVGSDESALAADDMPYTTLRYTNGLGFRDLRAETDADAGYNPFQSCDSLCHVTYRF